MEHFNRGVFDLLIATDSALDEEEEQDANNAENAVESTEQDDTDDKEAKKSKTQHIRKRKVICPVFSLS